MIRTALYGMLALLFFSSCKSNKELIYLQNLPEGETIQAKPFSTDSYQLKPGDNLFIQVSSINPEVNQLFNPAMGSGYSGGMAQQFGSVSSQYLNGYLIDQNGNIELPIIGAVGASNKTLAQVKKTVEQKVNEYFKEATVTVKLLNFKIVVMGEVSKPGVIYNYNNTCTLLEAISQAGGTTDYSRLKKVVVIRESLSGTTNIEIDLTDKAFLNSTAYYLQPNDIVYVWPDKYKNTRLNASLYSLILSSISTLIVVLKFMSE
ncbi:polysaccharide biosynthesis/export family protein [Mangrovibacterium marinum]|uniref:polysaccharide biosynthesis/export family protein n=1 Tax=Mangrovibacterium marinum TaxID=1639118 RepID=UPI00147281EF|nr:polysaccharide biosynthesis/export family protein [Mangrovibacterium marinum]